jgi:hypothetical protein
MAKFLETANKFYQYLEDKETWLNGSAPKRWLLADYGSMSEILDQVAVTECDADAYQVYGEVKDLTKVVPPEKEISKRTQLLFMAALTATLNKQFTAQTDMHSRTAVDSYRYEMSNNKAVRCHMMKLIKVLPELETAGAQQ